MRLHDTGNRNNGRLPATLSCPSAPNATAVQAALSHLEDDVLGPDAAPGLQLSRNLYRDLPLPWDVSPRVTSFVTQFSLFRQEWDVDGVLSDGKDFFGGGSGSTLAEIAAGLGTASIRWREINPELVRTGRDCRCEEEL